MSRIQLHSVQRCAVWLSLRFKHFVLTVLMVLLHWFRHGELIFVEECF